jgi:BirA family biotin operon repressor/biotin-[acetyl-CoA-carboxylase] ligase
MSSGPHDAGRIERLLARRDAALGRPLVVRAATGSTNDDAKEAARAGAPHGAAFLAEVQTAGRGRAGRLWHAPPGECICLSVVLRAGLDAEGLGLLSLVAGVAVARVVDAALAPFEQDVATAPLVARIKWPNDVYVGERKIAGILVESTTRGEEASAVVGIGLNVHVRAFPPPLDVLATSLALSGAPLCDRDVLVACLCTELGRALGPCPTFGRASILAELGRRDWLRGRRVRVRSAGALELEGSAEGCDARGRLLVRAGDGTLHALASGEVEWR